MKRRCPRQGEIYLISMDPTVGTEIHGMRPALVLSNSESNKQGRVLMAPITQGANIDRVRGWATSLMGTGTRTQGAAIVNQARFLDYAARKARFVEDTPAEVTEDAMARLQAALEAETGD
ncbi:type II toxin-antitoxin system PemK/MazF family toxin [Rugamonas aquatica]|uniref:Type II toxin-antitoxin system ChpB family toxin n=1 Tax=Rugamonas aquatica TaxID=2743357 RepID=A0A6A7N6K1_9BURK|nr:type II toxin-antitoxin system PemK/MazF family toxin [Rugamonas aquatica]MQA40502.1 type II toxin-antitoxin system ChpB family toxin [Rugamonas aquatica]